MFPPLQDLIPHRETALLLDRVLAHTAEQTSCIAVLEASTPYLVQGEIDVGVALELIAQTAAVHGGLAAKESQRQIAEAGYIVSIPHMKFFGGNFKRGDRLEISVCLQFLEGNLSRYEGRVWCGAEERARGTLLIYAGPINAGKAE